METPISALGKNLFITPFFFCFNYWHHIDLENCFVENWQLGKEVYAQ